MTGRPKPGCRCASSVTLHRINVASQFHLHYKAICGSCPKSIDSARSGIRCWAIFHNTALKGRGRSLPPDLDGLLQWSLTFRNAKTFSNYLGYLSLACAIAGYPTEIFKHPSLKRAKTAIRKRRLWTKKAPTFIHLSTLQRMIPVMIDRPETRDLLMLFLASYAFLLRVPSEGLPLAAHEAPPGAEATVFTVGHDCVKVHFPFRKNSYEPSVLTRTCSCKRCPLSCPVHVLGLFMKSLKPGTQPFLHIDRGQLRLALREMLSEIGVENACSYGSHSFRRGHADDIEQRGGSAAEICALLGSRSALAVVFQFVVHALCTDH